MRLSSELIPDYLRHSYLILFQYFMCINEIKPRTKTKLSVLVPLKCLCNFLNFVLLKQLLKINYLKCCSGTLSKHTKPPALPPLTTVMFTDSVVAK